jgi:hypothetical protein
MMKTRISLFVSLVIFILFLIHSGCTKNPFGTDKITTSDEIKGKVLLNDGASPDSIFVWLQGFNMKTWTNEDGEFKIKLPSPKSQGGAGLTGSYHLYFYVANYKIDSALVVVRAGRLEYSHGDIDDEGSLKEPKTLIKILEIQTVIDPPDFPQPTTLDWWEYEEVINVQVTLKATTADDVTTKFSSYTKGPASIVFIRRIFPKEDSLKIVELTPIASYDNMVRAEITSDPQKWSAGFKMMIGDLPVGTYKIIPYLLIEQENMPADLIKSLGEEMFKPHAKYLSLPFRRQDGDFLVKK